MQVSQKIKNAASKLGLPFNKATDIYALERLVARLNADPLLAEVLTYKGGFVLFKTSSTDRFTRDVDATASSVDKNILINHLLGCWDKDLDDGISFGEPSVTELTIETGDYGGVRLNLKYQLDVSKLEASKIHKLPKVHLDVGIGTSESSARKIPLKPLLAQEIEVSWKVLPLEYIFAEKLQTIVLRGSQNSRGKDIYDMAFLSSELENLSDLEKAIEEVFNKRATEMPENFQSFLKALNYDMLRRSWSAMSLKNPKGFDQSMFELIEFLGKLFRN